MLDGRAGAGSDLLKSMQFSKSTLNLQFLITADTRCTSWKSSRDRQLDLAGLLHFFLF
jgi:hypothetical protein